METSDFSRTVETCKDAVLHKYDSIYYIIPSIYDILPTVLDSALLTSKNSYIFILFKDKTSCIPAANSFVCPQFSF